MVLDLSNQKGYEKTIDAIIQELERENPISTKRISNEIVDYCVTKNDTAKIYIPVIVYIVYKSLTQNHIVNSKIWKRNKGKLLLFFENLKRSEDTDFKKQLNNFVFLFEKDDKDFFYYVKNISRKGRVKVGARLYSMGFSIKRVSDLLEVSNFDLQSYLSDTQMHNQKVPENLLVPKIEMLLKESKDVIFDSGALISIGNVGLINVFEEFKQRNPDVNLYMTEAVHNETIDIQEKVIRFGWIGIQYEYLIKKGIFTLIAKDKMPKNGTLEDLCNTLFYTRYGKLELLQRGELESVVFAQKNNCVLVIDEIVTRWLIEAPLKLHKLMESRYKEKVMYDKSKLDQANAILKTVPVIRSVDFIGFAIKQGYFKKYGTLNFKKPLLYSLKYGGCATTYEEIDSYIAKGDVNVKD